MLEFMVKGGNKQVENSIPANRLAALVSPVRSGEFWNGRRIQANGGIGKFLENYILIGGAGNTATQGKATLR